MLRARRLITPCLVLGLVLFACGDDREALIGDDEFATVARGDRYVPGGAVPNGAHGMLAFGVDDVTERVAALRSARASDFERVDTPPSWTGVESSTTVATPEGSALFFVARDGKVPALRKATIANGAVGEAVPVTVDGTTVRPWWPQTVGLPDGHVLLAFVEPQTSVFLGVDDEGGRRFTVARVSLPETDLRGVLAHVGVTAEGAWVLGYQIADEALRFRSSVRFSRDRGVTWTATFPARLSNAVETAGAYPIGRLDRGADIYYVVSGGGQSMIRRRAMHENGTLGPEQNVTDASIGSVRYPQPGRLADGRIALTFSIQRSTKERDLAVAVLEHDAPR